MSDPYPAVPEDDLSAGGWTLRGRTAETLFRTPTTTVEGHTLVYEDPALAAALAEAGVGDPPDTGRPPGGTGDPPSGDAARSGDAGEPSGGETDRRGGPPGDEVGGILAGRGDGTGGGPWRFFFATRLSFSPPLAPGIGPATVLPTVRSEARRSFAADLRSRGFRDVERGRSERMRTRSGDRARLTKYTATLDLSDRTDAGETDRAGDRRDDATGDEGSASLSVEAWLAVWSTRGSFRVAGGAYPAAGLSTLLAGTPDDGSPGIDPGSFRSELLDLVRAVE